MDLVSDHDVAVSEMINAYVTHLRAAGRSDNTISSRTRVLRRLHDHLPFGLAYASTEELEEFIGSGPWGAWTRRTYGNHIRAFYGWANGRHLQGDPSADMARSRKPSSVPRPVTDAQWEMALDLAPEPWLTAILLASMAGLRLSELAGVHREDVSEEMIFIRVAKGGDPAWVDTHPDVWQALRDRPPGPVNLRPCGKPAHAGWFSDNEREFFDSLGMPDVTLHRFRHWFATAMLDAGADIRVVQEALRHRSIASTQGYTQVTGGQRRLAIRSLPTRQARRPQEH